MDAGDTIPATNAQHGGDPMSMALIVANQTLPSQPLADAIAERIRSGVTSFYVVVPATPIGHGMTWDEETTRQDARERLNRFVEHLRSQGVEAAGEVGDRDPVAAVRDALRGRPVDEVVLSTLPPGISRWLGQDVPSKLRHNVSVPVAVVYEGAAAGATV
jgi:nucleotide-binding universal stress UspA family protein